MKSAKNALRTSLPCFNTDDGIRRAAIMCAEDADDREVLCFNTDDGIRRAAIPMASQRTPLDRAVFQYR